MTTARFYEHTPAAFSDACRADCAGCAAKELDEERAALLEEITADIELAKRYRTLPAESIAALERTAADLRRELGVL